MAFSFSSGATESLQLFIHPRLDVGTITEVAICVMKFSVITIFVKKRSEQTAQSSRNTRDKPDNPVEKLALWHKNCVGEW